MGNDAANMTPGEILKQTAERPAVTWPLTPGWGKLSPEAIERLKKLTFRGKPIFRDDGTYIKHRLPKPKKPSSFEEHLKWHEEFAAKEAAKAKRKTRPYGIPVLPPVEKAMEGAKVICFKCRGQHVGKCP